MGRGDTLTSMHRWHCGLQWVVLTAPRPTPTPKTQNNGFTPKEIAVRAKAMVAKEKHDDEGPRPAAWEPLRRFQREEFNVLGGPLLLAELYAVYQEVGAGRRACVCDCVCVCVCNGMIGGSVGRWIERH